MWRGARPGPSQQAMVSGEVRTLGRTLVVPVKLTSGRHDYIALTHVERLRIDTEATIANAPCSSNGGTS